MRPLTPDDLLPLDEFAAQRAEHFEAHRRYVHRYRRVRIGPRLTLQFENRQTLWFRVQELLRVARLADPARVREELAVYSELLPRRDLLQAALLIDIAHEAQLTAELAFWRSLRNDALQLRIGPGRYPARLITDRPEDRCIGAAQWVVFPLDAAARQLLTHARWTTVVEIDDPNYCHESAPLSDEVRQSLLDDLTLSDRDEETARAA
jgi:hypothetical protein